jgi:hypothetical protein
VSKDSSDSDIIPKKAAEAFGFGGQQMRRLYFNNHGKRIARGLNKDAVLRYMQQQGIDPSKTPMEILK